MTNNTNKLRLEKKTRINQNQENKNHYSQRKHMNHIYFSLKTSINILGTVLLEKYQLRVSAFFFVLVSWRTSDVAPPDGHLNFGRYNFLS